MKLDWRRLMLTAAGAFAAAFVSALQLGQSVRDAAFAGAAAAGSAAFGFRLNPQKPGGGSEAEAEAAKTQGAGR